MSVNDVVRVRARDRCETLCELGVTLCEDEVSITCEQVCVCVCVKARNMGWNAC